MSRRSTGATFASSAAPSSRLWMPLGWSTSRRVNRSSACSRVNWPARVTRGLVALAAGASGATFLATFAGASPCDAARRRRTLLMASASERSFLPVARRAAVSLVALAIRLRARAAVSPTLVPLVSPWSCSVMMTSWNGLPTPPSRSRRCLPTLPGDGLSPRKLSPLLSRNSWAVST